MLQKREDLIKFERTTISGTILIIVGITIIFFAPYFAIIFSNAIFNELPNVLSNVGAGLIGAGILTIILERSNRNRHKNDVAELKEAHFESVLKGLMPEPIFLEVQAHIIRQPFIRKNFIETVELSWVDGTKEYLRKSDTANYEIENISKTLEVYELRVSEERVNRDKFPNGTGIDEIKLQNKDFSVQSLYNGDKLADILEETDQYVRVIIPVRLPPGEKTKVTVKTSSIFSAKDVHHLVLNKPTIGFDITIAHPDDVVVSASPVHPSAHAFTKSNGDKLQRFRIEAGILPYQGIELSWWPKKDKVTIEQNEN